jgi:hypothetical protein
MVEWIAKWGVFGIQTVAERPGIMTEVISWFYSVSAGNSEIIF